VAEPASLREVHRPGRLVVRAAPVRARARGGAGAVAIADEPVVAVPATPYRGIRPFRYADHAIFFAREEETRQLASLVAVYRGVFLYGDSGNGKSSLVNAGLLPQARRLGFEPVRVRVQPRAGEELVIEPIEASDDGAEVLASPLVPQADGSSRVVLSIAEFEEHVRAAAHEHRPLLVFDQFEEILTLFDDEEGPASRSAIAQMIVRLLGEPLPVKLLFAFREDYLGRVKQLLGAHPELVDQALRLGPPSDDALETIIRGPFERFPGHFERELDPELAQRLGTALAERFGTGDVSLSEVQTVCLRLWESADPGALLADRGVQGVLEDELGEALDAFPADLRAAAVALLSEMVTSAGTRNVISAEDLRRRVRNEDDQIAPGLLDEALVRLERDSKLVRRERRRDLYLYEITSEFLVPWISRRREELHVIRERRRERRRLMRILGLIGGGLLILAVIVVAFVVSVDRQRARAQLQESKATSLALAASSAEPLSTRPDVSLALAFEAYRERPQAEAHAAVIRALIAARRSGLRGALPTDSVAALAFSADGRTLATAGGDGTIRLWNPTTHKQLSHFSSHTRYIGVIAFSPDGKTLATGGGDGTTRLWNPTTHKQLDRLTGHTGPVRAMAFSPDGMTLATGGYDGTIRLWNPTTHKQLGRLVGHTHYINLIAFSPDGKTLATASDDGTIRLWNPTTHKQLGHFTDRTRDINVIAFSPDGKTLATGGGDGSIRLWNPTTHKQLDHFTDRTRNINVIAFSPDGKTLATGGDDGTTRLWNPTTHKQLDRLTGHTGYINVIAFSPDGKTLATAGDDGTVRLWNPTAYKHIRPLTGPPVAVSAADYSAAVAFSRDGKTLATAGGGDIDGTILLWNPTTHKQLARFTAPTVRGFQFRFDAAIAFSPDGTTVATAADDGTVHLWNPTTHKQLGRDSGRASLFTVVDSSADVAFSPDGKILAATGGYDRTIRLWKLTTHTSLDHVTRLKGHSDIVLAVTFSPDGETVATGGDDGTIRLWNPDTHKQLAHFPGHAGAVTDVVFSPDGKTLAAAGYDGTIRLWNPTTHKQLAQLTGHTGPVRAMAFSPDGTTLATGGYDGTIRLWNPTTHKQLGRLTGHTGAVTDVVFSPDGRTLATGGEDGTVRLWSEVLWRTVAELKATVCDIILAGLTPSEWARYASGISYRRSCP
jgi:WD40 repeat protein